MKIPAGQRVFTRSSISSEQLEFFIPAPISKLCLEIPGEEIIVDASSNSQNGPIRPFAAIVASRGRMMLSNEVLGQTGAFIKLVDHWTNKRLSTDSICDLHAQLTGKGGVSSQFRDSIVWVDGLCPGDAKLIPGPASGVTPALQDYFDFLARRDVHDWIKLAIGYFQTLMIHPFFDGNGRVARTIALIRAQRFLGVAQAYALTAALSLHRRALRCFLDEVRRGELANYLDYWRKLIALERRLRCARRVHARACTGKNSHRNRKASDTATRKRFFARLSDFLLSGYGRTLKFIAEARFASHICFGKNRCHRNASRSESFAILPMSRGYSFLATSVGNDGVDFNAIIDNRKFYRSYHPDALIFTAVASSAGLATKPPSGLSAVS